MNKLIRTNQRALMDCILEVKRAILQTKPTFLVLKVREKWVQILNYNTVFVHPFITDLLSVFTHSVTFR